MNAKESVEPECKVVFAAAINASLELDLVKERLVKNGRVDVSPLNQIYIFKNCPLSIKTSTN